MDMAPDIRELLEPRIEGKVEASIVAHNGSV